MSHVGLSRNTCGEKKSPGTSLNSWCEKTKFWFIRGYARKLPKEQIPEDPGIGVYEWLTVCRSQMEIRECMISSHLVNRAHTRFGGILHSLGRLLETNQRISLPSWYEHPIDWKKLGNQRNNGILAQYEVLSTKGEMNSGMLSRTHGLNTGWAFGLSKAVLWPVCEVFPIHFCIWTLNS